MFEDMGNERDRVVLLVFYAANLGSIRVRRTALRTAVCGPK